MIASMVSGADRVSMSVKDFDVLMAAVSQVERLRAENDRLIECDTQGQREVDRLRAALTEIVNVDKAAPGRKDCWIWADMLEIAAQTLGLRDEGAADREDGQR